MATVFCLTNVPPPTAPVSSDDDGGNRSGLSEHCEDLVWKAKVAVTNDESMVAKVKEACAPNMDLLGDCLDTDTGYGRRYHVTGNGRVLSCLIEKSREEVALAGGHQARGLVEQCNQLLRQLEAVVFSDYRLLGDFIEHCKEDINSLKCGRVQDPRDSGHSQGKVVGCLMKSADNLTDMCREEIYK